MQKKQGILSAGMGIGDAQVGPQCNDCGIGRPSLIQVGNCFRVIIKRQGYFFTGLGFQRLLQKTSVIIAEQPQRTIAAPVGNLLTEIIVGKTHADPVFGTEVFIGRPAVLPGAVFSRSADICRI